MSERWNISTLDQNIVDKRDEGISHSINECMEYLTKTQSLENVCQVKRYGYYLLENFLGLLFFGKISIHSKLSQQK